MSTDALRAVPIAPANGQPSPLIAANAMIAIGLVLLVPTFAAYLIDERTLNGASIWAKPLKFDASLALHFASIVWLAVLIEPAALRSRLFRWSLIAGAASAVIEILYMTLQAARGRASHFNVETPIEAAMYSAMGFGATLIVLSSFIAGLLIVRRPSTIAGASAGLRWGGAIGLMLASALTLGFGFYLGGQGGHLVGAATTDATGLPVFGWSTTAGDLRVPHFFATHLMQALPIVGLVADRIAPRRAVIAVAAATVVGALIVIATFLQARAGLPLIAL